MPKWIFPVVVLILLSLPATWPLFKSNFYSTHDGITHVVRFAKFEQDLREGQLVPRWASGVAFNLGSPVLMYNAPLPYLFTEVPRFLGLDLASAIECIASPHPWARHCRHHSIFMKVHVRRGKLQKLGSCGNWAIPGTSWGPR